MTSQDELPTMTRARVLPSIRAMGAALIGRTILLVGLLALGLVAVFWWPAWWLALHDRFTPRYEGQIIVNSPAVYTRQRLVNDRLAQSAWLQEQLRVTTREFDSAFRSIDEIRTVRNSSSLKGQIGIGAPAGGSAPPSGTSSPAEETKNDTEAPTIAPTSADLFRAKNTYREEVRAEIMETQLDDRHDIQGNTIYRLSFDATVLPGTRSDALAVIKVKLSHVYKPVKEDYEQAEKKETTLDREYFQLYEDWLRFMQKLVQESVANITQTLFERKPDDRVAQTLPIFLLKRVCEYMQGREGRNDRACDPAAQPNDPSEQLKAAAKRISEFKATYLAARRARFEHQMELNIISAAKNEKPRLENEKKRLENEKKRLENEDKLLEAESKRSENEKKRLENENKRLENENKLLENENKLLMSVNKRPESYLYALDESYQVCEQTQKPVFHKNASETNESLEIKCPIVNGPFEGLIGATVLYNELAQNLPDTPDEAHHVFAQLRAETEARCAGAKKENCSIPDTTKENLRCLVADYMWARLNLHDRPDADKFASGHRFDRYFQVHLVGREAGMCNVVFLAAERDKDKVTNKNKNKDKDKDGEEKDPVARMRNDLNNGVEIYAYSITPKNLAQRLSTASDTRDAIQALLNANFGAGGRDVSSLVETLQKKSTQSQAIQALPIVVGFGFAPAGLQESPETEFGWAIAPQIILGKQDERAHSDRQYPLAAVISVPSWWRSMYLEVETCWVERAELHKQIQFKHCRANGTGGNSQIRHKVRLPGVISELSRKLGYEVVEEPRLEYRYPEDAPLRLEIGRPAQVLLIGGRIWRSTEVTLGAQKADEIAVLPNMAGVLAKFRCVRRQLADEPGKPAVVPIRVWTSEGVTVPPEHALLVEPTVTDGTKDKREDMCPEEWQELQAHANPKDAKPR
jgi:hypothetical protein